MKKDRVKPRRIKLRPEAVDLLIQEKQNFINLMGRQPDSYDPVLISKYFYSENEFKRMTIMSMIQAGIDERLIYIFDKTGFVLDKRGYDSLGRQEKGEVDKFDAEYRSFDNVGPIYNIKDFDDSYIDEYEPLPRCVYILGDFIDRNFDANTKRLSTRNIIEAYLVVRSYRILRAVLRMQNFSTGEEMLLLTRSLFECYCKLIFVTNSKINAKYILDADLGLQMNTHMYQLKNGKINKKCLLIKKQAASYQNL